MTDQIPASNGHATLGATPAPEVGSQVELDPKKIGMEGHQLLGQVQALTRWAMMFAAYRDKSLDLNERRILGEVVKALDQDAEKHKIALTQFALKRGAAKVSEGEEGGN